MTSSASNQVCQGPRGHRARRITHPDVKKLRTGDYGRAKLDHCNRLLLQFASHGGQTMCLALQLIDNHAHDKSRFRRGAQVARIDDMLAGLLEPPSQTARRVDASSRFIARGGAWEADRHLRRSIEVAAMGTRPCQRVRVVG